MILVIFLDAVLYAQLLFYQNFEFWIQALCAAVYRIKSPKWGTLALNHFHESGTVAHAVVGGHGSDSATWLGVVSRFGEGLVVQHQRQQQQQQQEQTTKNKKKHLK